MTKMKPTCKHRKRAHNAIMSWLKLVMVSKKNQHKIHKINDTSYGKTFTVYHVLLSCSEHAGSLAWEDLVPLN